MRKTFTEKVKLTRLFEDKHNFMRGSVEYIPSDREKSEQRVVVLDNDILKEFGLSLRNMYNVWRYHERSRK